MSKPLLCVTVTAATTAELRQRRDAVADADLIELRLDTVSDPSVAGALAGRRCPVIVTCRPVWEGGGFKGAEEDRKQILADALNLSVKEGVLVGVVTKGSPAAKAGIEGGASNMVIEGTGVHPGGDVLLEFDGKKVTNMRQLAGIVDTKKQGDEVHVVFLHNGMKKSATIKLAVRPETPDTGDSNKGVQ